MEIDKKELELFGWIDSLKSEFKPMQIMMLQSQFALCFYLLRRFQEENIKS